MGLTYVTQINDCFLQVAGEAGHQLETYSRAAKRSILYYIKRNEGAKVILPTSVGDKRCALAELSLSSFLQFKNPS